MSDFWHLGHLARAPTFCELTLSFWLQLSQRNRIGMAMLGAKEAATPEELAPMASERSVFTGGDRDVAGLWDRWCEAVQRSRGWAKSC